MDNFLLFNSKAACRLCLKIAPDLPSIFTELGPADAQSSPSLASRISACVGFEVTDKEKLPSRICSDCLQEVDRWFVFQAQCKATNTLLTKVLLQGFQIVGLSLQDQVTKKSHHGNSRSFLMIKDSADKEEFNIGENAGSTEEQSKFDNCKSKNIPSSALETVVLHSHHTDNQECDDDDAHEGGDHESESDQERGNHETGSVHEKKDHESNEGESRNGSDGESSSDEFGVELGTEDNENGEDTSWRQKPAKCPLCLKVYGNHNKVKSHLRIQHTVLKPHPCMICGHVSLTSTAREKHVTKKHKEILQTKYLCHICGLKTSQRSSYYRHLQRHKHDRTCESCKITLDTEEALQEHKKTAHTGGPIPGVDPSYHCHHCENVSFWKKEDWKQHYVDVHKTEECYPCPTCNKAFRLKCLMEEHKQIHTGEKPYLCELCSRRFATKHSLRHHVRDHSRSYPCPKCNKVFNTLSGFNYHRRSHESFKPYQCHQCGKTFKSEQGMAMHARTHTGEKPHKCDQCEFSARTMSGLYAHRAKHTNEKPFKCDQCGQSFKMKAWLKTHSKIHTGVKDFICDVCSHAFVAMYQLRSHMKTHSGERPHICEICSKAFARRDTLTEHKRTHTNETKYICEHCNGQFAFLKPFKRHKCAGKPISLNASMSDLHEVSDSLSNCFEDYNE